MHAKPDLRVVLEWTIAGSGSVIAAVIQLRFLRHTAGIVFMGADLLDLTFRLEKEFEIEIPSEAVHEMLRSGNTDSPPSGAWADTQVSDFVSLIESILVEANDEIPDDLFHRTQVQVSECLAVPVDDVKLDSWFVRDLGAE